jgi:GT2 family glycosyltransferase
MIATKIIGPLGLMWPSKEKENREFYCGDFVGAGVIVKREALEKTRYYPKEYFIFWNEEELAAQLLNRGYRIKYFPEAITYHKGDTSQRMSRKRFYFMTRNKLWTFWMHDPVEKLIRKTLWHLMVHFVYFNYLGKGSEHALYALTYFKSTFDAIRGLPTCIRNREVVNSPYWDVKA